MPLSVADVKRHSDHTLPTKSHFKFSLAYVVRTRKSDFYKFFQEKGIKIERNVEPLEYSVKGKKHKYFPDFKIGNTLYEIKGDHLKKIESFKYKLDFCKKNNIVIDISVKDLFDFFNHGLGRQQHSLFGDEFQKEIIINKPYIYKYNNIHFLANVGNYS